VLSAFKISDLFIGFTRQFLSEQVPNQRPMPWRKNMTVGDRTMVADRIGGGTFCKKICKTAKGGSLPMTALALGCVFSISACFHNSCPFVKFVSQFLLLAGPERRSSHRLDSGLPKMGKRACFLATSIPFYACNIAETAE
jgi:hypothetical protein